jgi:FMN reductase
MSPRTIAVVSAGLSQPSSTRLLADRLAEAAVAGLAARGVDAEVRTIELRELAQDVTNHLLTGFPSPRLAAAIDDVVTADGVVAVSPVFSASYSGLFKSFVDVLDPTSLAGRPVLLGATGGSERHSLAIDYAMRPLFAYLKARTTATAVYAASADWGAAGSAATGSGAQASGATALADRIARAGDELAELVAASAPVERRDPFALPAGFDPSGGAGLAA